VNLSSSTARNGLAQMLAFYASVPATGCGGPDGDMLLFQWGTYDWGKGRHFELNITRQFIEQGLEDDDAISQLSLTYRFTPNPELDALADSNLGVMACPSCRPSRRSCSLRRHACHATTHRPPVWNSFTRMCRGLRKCPKN
jgi:hypothetical protein